MHHRTLFAGILSLLLSASALIAGKKSGTLDVIWIDVEGGGATLIVTPNDESVLIDSGNPGGRDSQRILKAIKEEAGLDHLDHLIATHFHLDHFGGAAEVAAELPIHHVWDNGIPERNPDNRPNDTRFPLMIKPYRSMKVGQRHVIRPDDILPLAQPANGTPFQLRCIAANQVFSTRKPAVPDNQKCQDIKLKQKDRSDNANSVVMIMEFGPFRFFDGGDLSWNVEGELACPNNIAGTVDVYQVNHHGLDASNNPLLVHSLAPTVSVMANGTRKGCGPESFAALASSPGIQAMYQVHKNLREDSENNTSKDYIANFEKDCDAHFIKMSVAPDGKNYTMSIPATGHKRTFQTRLNHLR